MAKVLPLTKKTATCPACNLSKRGEASIKKHFGLRVCTYTNIKGKKIKTLYPQSRCIKCRNAWNREKKERDTKPIKNVKQKIKKFSKTVNAMAKQVKHRLRPFKDPFKQDDKIRAQYKKLFPRGRAKNVETMKMQIELAKRHG